MKESWNGLSGVTETDNEKKNVGGDVSLFEIFMHLLAAGYQSQTCALRQRLGGRSPLCSCELK